MTFTGYVYHLIQPLSHLCHQCTPSGLVLMVIKWPKKSVGHTQMSLRHLMRLPDCVGLWRGGLCVHCGALHKSIEWQLRRKSRTDCILSSAYLWVRLQFNHIQYWLTLSGNHFLWVGVALEMAHVHIIWWNFSERIDVLFYPAVKRSWSEAVICSHRGQPLLSNLNHQDHTEKNKAFRYRHFKTTIASRRWEIIICTAALCFYQ